MTLKDFEKHLLISFADKSLPLDYSLEGDLNVLRHDIFGDNDNREYYGSLFGNLRELVSVDEDSKRVTLTYASNDSASIFLHGIWLLKYFAQSNCTGPEVALDDKSEAFLNQLDNLSTELIQDGEGIVDNVHHPGILLVAHQLFDEVPVDLFPSVNWWKMRTDFLHERILEEKSSILWRRIKSYEEIVKAQLLSSDDKILLSLFSLEMAAMYLFHFHVNTAKDLVSYASTLVGVDISFAGALGKRTRYQQTELPQLIVKVATTEHKIVSDLNSSALEMDFPKNIPLEDDTRLNTIQLTDAAHVVNLNHIQQLLLLQFFFLRKSFQAEDDITRTEGEACLRALLNKPLVWTIQFVSLLQRSIMERSHSRTVGRSMDQLECLKTSFSTGSPTSRQRLHFFFSFLVPMWFKLEEALADIYISMGSINSALDVYLRLRMWENAIECYNRLKLRHKAEELIRQEIQKGETVKLWCLLGDATDDVSFYEKAWILSKNKSARAQRQWGYYYFQRKQYEDAVDHLEKAVELNPLDYPVWLRLAFAAMQIEKWELCAKAYRHSCILDSDNFEAWNNLSNAYLKLNDKPRALKVLIEATKCDYDIWQVWDNLLVVATDCREFEEVIRSYNRLLDLREKHADAEVLGVLSRFICSNLEDSKNTGSIRHLKPALKLVGRITAKVTTNGPIWKLYSDLLTTEDSLLPDDSCMEILHRSVDCAQKSVRCLMQDPKWDKFDDSIKLVVEYAQNLALRTKEFVTKYGNSANAATLKGSATFTVNRVIAALNKKKLDAISDTETYDPYILILQNALGELN